MQFLGFTAIVFLLLLEECLCRICKLQLFHNFRVFGLIEYVQNGEVMK